jgi:hypothetical protein
MERPTDVSSSLKGQRHTEPLTASKMCISAGCAGLPKQAVQDVYRAAITKAGSSNTQQQLSNGFVAALTQIDDANSGQDLLDNLLAALDGTVKASGCPAAEKFAQGEADVGCCFNNKLGRKGTDMQTGEVGLHACCHGR